MPEEEAELKDIWTRCFPDDLGDHQARADAERNWGKQRDRHLPLTRDIIGARSEALRYGTIGDPRPDEPPVLLLMAGYSVEQLALVIAAHVGAGCRTVVPFSSRDVWAAVKAEVNDCLRALEVPKEMMKESVEVDSASPADVFQKLMRWFQENSGARCAIDCTGGKKPMDSGAAHAGSFYGLPVYYLDFDKYHPVLRRPLPWTCVYRELPLPETAFGLASRTRVVDAFERGRFWDAKMAMSDVVGHAQQSNFFGASDLTDLKAAAGQVNEAAAWMDLRYDELPHHRLHESFKNVSKTKPRQVVEKLLAPDRFYDLFQYLVDEYYRLGLLFNAEQTRDALVGLVGLAEIVIERMFGGPWFERVCIKTSTPLNWPGKPDKRLPSPDDLDSWNEKPMPRGCLPPSSFTQKVRLLRKGQATFDIMVLPTADGPSPASWDKGLLVRVEVALQDGVQPPLGALDNTVWNDCLDFPHGAWVQSRHALAHLRAPLLEVSAVAAATKAYEIRVPRLVELLYRLHVNASLDVGNIRLADWLTWQKTVPWRKHDCVPGHGEADKLKKLLRVGV
ncbi:MAG: hypothetical protein H6716_23995 [Polyangiaceae bacterium]|nr:hypothetical protein [Polyangiaceae bacterium]